MSIIGVKAPTRVVGLPGCVFLLRGASSDVPGRFARQRRKCPELFDIHNRVRVSLKIQNGPLIRDRMR